MKKINFIIILLWALACAPKIYNLKIEEEKMSFNNQSIKILSVKKESEHTIFIDFQISNDFDKEKWFIFPLPIDKVIKENEIKDYEGIYLCSFKEEPSIKYVEVWERLFSLHRKETENVGFTGFLVSPHLTITIRNFSTRVIGNVSELKKVEALTAEKILYNGKSFSEIFPSPISLKKNVEIKYGYEKDVEWIKSFSDISPSLPPFSQLPPNLEIKVEKKYSIQLQK